MTATGPLHVAVRDNMADDEIIVETTYRLPDAIQRVSRHFPQPGTTTVTFHEAGRTTVVNEVPAEVCENCGEAYVAEDTTIQLLAIAANARRSAAVVLVRDFASAA